MHNLIILGSGRSGTSMVASMFRHSGAYMGERMLTPTRANPTGYYEDHQLNVVNNPLIEAMIDWPRLNRLRRRVVCAAHADRRAYWLAAPRRLRVFSPGGQTVERMKQYAARQPFCYKDPRFSVTLRMWEAVLPRGTRRLVVFRDPGRTVRSILRDACESYDPPLAVTAKQAYRGWLGTYERLLAWAQGDQRWLFVSYDQVIAGHATDAIERFTGAKLDTRQFDPRISRSRAGVSGQNRRARRCRALYERLLARAGVDLGRHCCAAAAAA